MTSHTPNDMKGWKYKNLREEFEKFDRDELFSRMSDIGEAKKEKVINWWLSKLSSQKEEIVKRVEESKVVWKLTKEGECDVCTYLEHSGEEHGCESYNRGLTSAITIINNI